MIRMLALRIDKRDKAIIYSISAILGVVVILNATFVWPGYLKRPDYDFFVVLAIIIAIFPPSGADVLDRRWRSAVNNKLPEVIRDIADSQKTGMAFTRAIEHSASLDYGPLTKELRKTVALLSWGWTYEDALYDLARRVDTPLVHRTVAMLVEVGRAGGRLYEILDNVYTHLREVQDLERERRRQMGPYIMVVFASFGVFLFVVYILFITFFAQIEKLIEAGATFMVGVNPQVYYIWFFHMAVIEALLSGFVAGKMAEGAVSAGLKYVLLLLIITIFFFLFIIGPP